MSEIPIDTSYYLMVIWEGSLSGLSLDPVLLTFVFGFLKEVLHHLEPQSFKCQCCGFLPGLWPAFGVSFLLLRGDLGFW